MTKTVEPQPPSQRSSLDDAWDELAASVDSDPEVPSYQGRETAPRTALALGIGEVEPGPRARRPAPALSRPVHQPLSPGGRSLTERGLGTLPPPPRSSKPTLPLDTTLRPAPVPGKAARPADEALQPIHARRTIPVATTAKTGSSYARPTASLGALPPSSLVPPPMAPPLSQAPPPVVMAESGPPIAQPMESAPAPALAQPAAASPAEPSPAESSARSRPSISLEVPKAAMPAEGVRASRLVASAWPRWALAFGVVTLAASLLGITLRTAGFLDGPAPRPDVAVTRSPAAPHSDPATPAALPAPAAPPAAPPAPVTPAAAPHPAALAPATSLAPSPVAAAPPPPSAPAAAPSVQTPGTAYTAAQKALVRQLLLSCRTKAPPQQIIAVLGDSGWVRRGLGVCAAALRPEEAAVHFRAALAQAPEDRLALLGLARVLERRDDAAALELYHRYVEQAPPRGARKVRSIILAVERRLAAAR